MAATATVVGALAGRYAQAFYQLADETKQIDRAEADLRAVQTLIRDNDQVADMIRSPLVSRADQGAAITALARALGLSDITQRFLGLLAANRRLFALPQIIRAFLDDLARRRGDVAVRVTAAHPLSRAQQDQLADAIKGTAGSNITIDMTVDPDLLGGLVVQIGSRLIDASVRTRLTKMHLAMKDLR